MNGDKEVEINTKAFLLWDTLDEKERFGVRIGLFPFRKMQSLESEGFNPQDVCVALMKRAKLQGHGE
jgi:hypothetical protein